MVPIAEILSRVLLSAARAAGADDPEAVAHDIIVRALEGRVTIHTGAKAYLYQAAHHGAQNYRRRVRRLVHDLAQAKAAPTDDHIDARLALSTLAQADPAGLAFMVAYVGADHHPAAHRTRALRLRRRMRALLS